MTQATATAAPRRINKTEASRQLGVSVHQVDRLIKSGELQLAELPMRVYANILQSSVDQLIIRSFGEVAEAS